MSACGGFGTFWVWGWFCCIVSDLLEEPGVGTLWGFGKLGVFSVGSLRRIRGVGL